jgi:hypothetical protein
VFIVPRKDSNICGKVTKEVDIKNKWCLAYSKEFLEKGSCVNQRDITDDGEFTLPED